jgi:peptidoglycan/xylan/chitin deacetylase (PgdA/CDA1 family)
MTSLSTPGSRGDLATGTTTPARSTWVWPDSAAVSSRSVLKSVKLAMLTVAERTGVFRAVRESSWRTRRLLILAYHGISLGDEHQWSPELYLPSDALRARFELIRDGGYTVLPLRDAVTRLHQGTLPSRAVAITFDDGMWDFKAVAVPLLQEFQFPATVYVTTYYAQKQVPIFKIACRYLLWRGRGQTISGDDLTVAGGPLPLLSSSQRDLALFAVEQRLRQVNGGVTEEMATLRRLAERVGADFDQFLANRHLQIMTPDEIGSLPAGLVSVQLHTHRHRVPLREAPFQREIEENRNALAAWRPDEVLDGFCYPSGVTDPRFLPWLRSLGIRTGLTCDPGMATASTDPLLLPRLVDSTRLTRLEFEAWLTGVGSLLPSVRGRGGYRPVTIHD